ncbi:MAG TPA: trigger factor [Blastocatellia bacterium]|nr:trigger factor [Blastocatellia bacterium]
MNITVTDQEQCKKQIRVEIPSENVREETNKVAADLARKVNVPGFRRGHVPASVVKTRFRKELRDEVLSHLVPHALGDAIREKDLKVIGEPSIQDLKFGEDESIDVTFTVEVAPEFELSNFKNLSLTKRVYKVRDEDVDKTIDRIRQGQTELVPVEDRGAEAGDIITANITGKYEQAAPQEESDEDKAAEHGETALPSEAPERAAADESEGQVAAPAGEAPVDTEEEIKQEDVEIELGAKGVLEEFTEGLSGARPGDVRTFVVEYPPDYRGEAYAGRRIHYTAEVTAVRAKEMPELDDAFAQSVNEQFKTADDLRSDIRSRLEHDMKHRSEDELRNEVLEQLVEQNKFAVPEFIVQKQIDSRMQQLIRQLSGQGMDPRQLQLDWKQVREAQRERAEREVRGSFVLDKIAEVENVEVTEDEVDQEVERIAQSFGQEPAALRARLTKDEAMDSIKEQVRNRKALDIVIASADIKTEEVEGLTREESASGEKGEQAEE